ncbi:hypothetical protein ACSBR2_002399 [Camellia fascicularis]
MSTSLQPLPISLTVDSPSLLPYKEEGLPNLGFEVTRLNTYMAVNILILSWAIKKQHVDKMSVAEMRMLRWMCGKTRQDRIRNECIREWVGVAPIEDKLRENRLRWFGHIQRRPTEAVVKRCDAVTVDGSVRGRGRPRLMLTNVINRDMNLLNLTNEMAFDRATWRRRIHVADPI